MRDPDKIGDAALYKSELIGARARPAIEEQLRALESAFPDVELPPLLVLPEGTLGRTYAELLTANGLQPFRISDAVDGELLRRNIFMARYALLHDVYHVLTGYDTSWAGEAGVWGFVVGQNYRWSYWIALLMACLLYPLFSPRQLFAVWRNAYRGVLMGRRAKTLIALPLEHMWSRPVSALRADLAIEVAAA